MTTVAEAIRKVTAAMQNELGSGRRSTQIDANDLIDVLLAVADHVDPPLAKRPERGCEFCRQEYNRPDGEFACPYCGKVWSGG